MDRLPPVGVRPLVVPPMMASTDSPMQQCQSCGARRASVCSAIPDADLARLASVAVHAEIPRGRTFIEEGEPATDFFNITHGTAKLFKLLPDGRQQVTGFASTGHFLGLAVSRTYAFSAEAIEPVRLCRFSRVKLQAVLTDFPALERKLLETACNELATAQEQMLLLGRKTARERVASFLLSRLQSAACCAQTDEIRLPMTRSEIADFVGLTIETVSRTFSLFRKEGRIMVPSHDLVVILDQAWLEDLAAGSMAS